MPADSLADLLDGVRWDYDPSRRELSPLLPAVRYFQDFPWSGEGASVAEELADGGERLTVVAENLEHHHDGHGEDRPGDSPDPAPERQA